MMNSILSMVMCTGAWAQSPVRPRLDGQLYRPPIDGNELSWTESVGRIQDSWTTSPRLALHFANRPYRLGATNLVGRAVQGNLVAATAVNRFRVAVDLPLTFDAVGALVVGQRIGIADMALDARVTLLDPESAAVGVAVRGRLSLPTGTLPGLSAEAVTSEVSAAAEARLGERAVVALNVGHRFAPDVDVGGVTVGDQLVWRAGLGGRILDSLGVSLDAGGRVTYGAVNEPIGVPIEAMAGMWARMGAGWTLQGAVGRGLNQGIGASSGRAMVMVTFEQASSGRDHTAPDEPSVAEPSAAEPSVSPPVDRITPGRIIVDGSSLKVGFVATQEILHRVAEQLRDRSYITEIRFISGENALSPQDVRAGLEAAGWTGQARITWEDR